MGFEPTSVDKSTVLPRTTKKPIEKGDTDTLTDIIMCQMCHKGFEPSA